MGIDLDVFDVISWSSLEYFVSSSLKMKGKEEEFRIVIVYGSSYEKKNKPSYLNFILSL